MQIKLKVLCILNLAMAITACSSNYADESDVGKPTMKEQHEAHIAGIYGNKVEVARLRFSEASGQNHSSRSVQVNNGPQLPNPELRLVVFPRRNSDGSVQPNFVVKFPMYGKVHYQIDR